MSADQLFSHGEAMDPEVLALITEYKLLADNALRTNARMSRIRMDLEKRGLHIDPSSHEVVKGARRQVALRDLGRSIVRTLEKEGRAMTSPQIASALWREEYGISMDKMVRRVIVTASAMWKHTPPRLIDTGIREQRANYWALPQWRNEQGDLMEQHKPKSRMTTEPPPVG